jgi:hypothetical protein
LEQDAVLTINYLHKPHLVSNYAHESALADFTDAFDCGGGDKLNFAPFKPV